MASMFLLSACSKDDNKKDENKPNTDQVDNSGNNNGTSDSEIPDTEGKVPELDVKLFKEYIWDYEKNPEKVVYKGKKTVIVDFNAVWCGPCQALKPVVENLAEEYKGKAYFFSVDIDKASNAGSNGEVFDALSKIYNLTGIPVILMCSPYGDEIEVIKGGGSRAVLGLKKFLNDHVK